MATVKLGEITIGFDDVGAGANALLLIHGHPFDRTMWQPQLAAARRAGWRVIAPDLRGYGESTVVPGTTPLETFAADLAALLDHLGIDGAVVAGLSMGGQIAMEFARAFPDRVRGMLLSATFPRAETVEGKRQRRATADRLVSEGMSAYAEEVLPKMLARGSIDALPDVAAHVLRMMRQTDPEGAAAALRGRAERPPYDDVLAAIRVPALVVVGDEDAFTTRADAERMRALLHDSELVWLEGVGHMPNLERADAFNLALLGLLERVEAASGAAGRVAQRGDRREHLYRIDYFLVPAAAREEFLARVRQTHELLRRQPGFLGDHVFERPVEGGQASSIVTLVEWSSLERVEEAKAQVLEMRRKEGIDVGELLGRLGVEAVMGIYRPIEL